MPHLLLVATYILDGGRCRFHVAVGMGASSVISGSPATGSSSSSSSSSSSKAKIIGWLSGLLVILGGAASFTTVVDWVGGFFSAAQETGISQPADGASVAHRVSVDGVTGPGSGQQQWLVVEIGAIGRFYPGPSSLSADADGRWRQDLFVGGDADARGDAYTIHLVELSDSAEDFLSDYRSAEEVTGEVIGMTRLQLDEAGAEFLDSRRVVRG